MFIQRGVLEITFDLTAIQFRVAVGVGSLTGEPAESAGKRHICNILPS